MFILCYIPVDAQHFIVGFSFWNLLDFELVLIEHDGLWWFWNLSFLSGTSPIKGFHVFHVDRFHVSKAEGFKEVKI